MSDAPIDALDPVEAVGDHDEADERAVEQERAKLQEFIKSLNPDDIKSGGWFTKLITQGLMSYTEKATWQYFQNVYEGVPAHAIVDQRIKMAARYAALEGGLSAGAYTAAVLATIGSLGGASGITVPAAVATVMVDVAFIAQLQIRLAYDIAVLYRVPIDVSDPDDLWKLIRVAFTIKGGEVLSEGAIKVVPPLMRPIVKSFYKGPVLAAGKGLPFVGKFLLQRNVIKIAIPAVGVPLAVVLNRYTTLVAGRHAKAVFQSEARVTELARDLSLKSTHPQSLLWVAWLVIMADQKISDNEALLMRRLVKQVRDEYEIVDEQLAQIIELDPAEVWRRLDAESGELRDIVDAAGRIATVDGPVNARERDVLAEIEERCTRD